MVAIEFVFFFLFQNLLSKKRDYWLLFLSFFFLSQSGNEKVSNWKPTMGLLRGGYRFFLTLAYICTKIEQFWRQFLTWNEREKKRKCESK